MDTLASGLSQKVVLLVLLILRLWWLWGKPLSF
jgi:hypothetical protein